MKASNEYYKDRPRQFHILSAKGFKNEADMKASNEYFKDRPYQYHVLSDPIRKPKFLPGRCWDKTLQMSQQIESGKGFNNELLEKFRPVLVFHPDEKWYPINFDQFMNTQSESTEPYIYAFSRDEMGHTDLIYCMFYSYNEFKRNFGINGDHPIDLEHVTIRISNGTIEKIYYACHGYNDGITSTPGQFELHDNRPVVYIARGSHGCYPHGKTYNRAVGFASDYCARGRVINNYNLIILSENDLMMTMKSQFGPKTGALTSQQWFSQES